jgi:hypothetical protein
MQRVKTIMRVSCMRVGPLALSATIDRSYIYGTDVSRPYFRIWHFCDIAIGRANV